MTSFKILEVKQSQELDRLTIQGGFVSGEELMRRAGHKIALEICHLIGRRSFSKNILLLAGKGNNGGDAIVASRVLHEQGFNPTLCFLGSPDQLSSEALHHHQQNKSLSLNVEIADTLEKVQFVLDNFSGDVLVDGILGTGFLPPLKSFFQSVIHQINLKDLFKVAIDIPSGLDGDGVHHIDLNDCVHADLTLTIGSVKKGQLKSTHRNAVGQLKVLDIGFPSQLVDSLPSVGQVFVPDSWIQKWSVRKRNSHKGTYGHVLLVGGAMGYCGSILLSARGALRSGAGLVTVCSPEASQQVHHANLPEGMTLTWEHILSRNSSLELLKKDLSPYKAIGMGPGLKTDTTSLAILELFLKNFTGPKVLDSDLLNLLAEKKLDSHHFDFTRCVLTPHPGEAARLLNTTVEDIESHRFESILSLSQKFKAVVVLKGCDTCVTDGKKVWVHLTGTPAMATGGMGDVLTGVITSLLGQGYSPLDASNLGVSICGLAGLALEESVGPFGGFPSELANLIPVVVKQYQKNELTPFKKESMNGN